MYQELEHDERILRPHNYGTDGVPGRGWGIFHAADGTDVAVLNFQGRTYMTPIENPFTDFDRLVDEASEPLPPVRVVDFHCELTSEKNAFGIYLDGRASAVVGTHTHVATADERIMPKGTAYQSDLGMCGPVHSVIGFDPATVIPRFLNGLPTRFEVGSGPVVFNACQIDVDPDTGRAAGDRARPAHRRGLACPTTGARTHAPRSSGAGTSFSGGRPGDRTPMPAQVRRTVPHAPPDRPIR